MRSEEEFARWCQLEDAKDQFDRLLEFSNAMQMGHAPPQHTNVDVAGIVASLTEIHPNANPEPLHVWYEAAEKWRLTGEAPENLVSIKLRARSTMLLLLSSLRRAVTALESERKAGEEIATPQVQSGPNSAVADLMSLLDDSASAIFAIAGDQNKSLDERMRQIAIAKPEAAMWKSSRWAELLQVTGSRIRQTETWKAWRASEKRAG